MYKKVISVFITIIILCLSFYYTNKVINFFREKDPIMIEIKKYSEIYSDTKVDSILINNDIIPGIKGSKIDINNSYKKMKKAGKFDKNLLVFEETTPENNIKNNYKNNIISLNQKQDNISIIFELYDTEYVIDILTILKNNKVNATFFVSKDIFDNSIDLIKYILSTGNKIELLSNNYSIYEVNKYNSILKMISSDKLNFCLNSNKDNTILKACESSKLYSVVPIVKKTNNLYNYVKNNLKNGLIISVSNTKSVLNELSSTIKYIEQKGKKMVLLKSIIE